MLPAESRPSPWLTWLVPVALSVGTSVATTSVSLGERVADLRHVQRLQETHEERLARVESRANGTDVVLERVSTELRHIREGVDELRNTIRGGTRR